MPDRYTKTLNPPKQQYDITGQKFGRLTVVKLLGKQHRKYIWECVCACGNRTQSAAGDLRHGKRTSCGCGRRKHGLSFDPVYGAWAGMLQRCYNPEAKRFPDWGGRGIGVCAGWLADFRNFFSDMGHPPSRQHSLDRENNNEGYHCGHCSQCRDEQWTKNCRWATRSEQQRNTRQTKTFTVNGEAKPLIEWAALFNISHSTLRGRIEMGWNIDDALNMPIHSWNPARRRPFLA